MPGTGSINFLFHADDEGETMLDLTGSIIAYENGELEEDEIIELFQSMLDCGLCWELQGSYGRVAKSLIETGLIVLK